MKKIYEKYKHAIPLITYAVIYLIWFIYLEKNVTKNYRVIHVALDDYIPFCEFFVIPYFLWFIYVAAVVIFFLFKSKEDYIKSCIFLFTGMTIFLIISTLFPNGHHLRPLAMPRDNIFTHLITYLYHTDTPTNLWPSIHVYNSLGAHFAITKSSRLANKKWLVRSSLILCISIILSTMLLKQHSVFDVVTAFIMAAIMYGIVYKYDIVMAHKGRAHARKKATPQVN
ncbi:MAG: phosphatase PAP2 family protein [Clostridiales bacterium]|nr:phosphatase PAP2 family protein [Clostridiales bacterium]